MKRRELLAGGVAAVAAAYGTAYGTAYGAQALNYAVQQGAAEICAGRTLSRALQLALAGNGEVAAETIATCGRHLDILERHRCQTGQVAADNLSVLFDQTDPMLVNMRVSVIRPVTINMITLSLVIAP